MIIPVNGHILIEPVVHDSFIASERETYEEIGIVVRTPLQKTPSLSTTNLNTPVGIGDKVYFDSWLAAKYPKNEKEFFWLVKWEDVRAIEYAKDTVSE